MGFMPFFLFCFSFLCLSVFPLFDTRSTFIHDETKTGKGRMLDCWMREEKKPYFLFYIPCFHVFMWVMCAISREDMLFFPSFFLFLRLLCSYVPLSTFPSYSSSSSSFSFYPSLPEWGWDGRWLSQ